MADKNYYEILGLSEEDRNLPEGEFNEKLKKVRKNLARQWHPDRFSTKPEAEQKEAEEKFKEIEEAYNTLSDPEKRRQYDFQQGGGFGDDFDPFAGFDPFGMFRGRQNPQNMRYKGRDIQVQVKITLEEAYRGCEKEFSYYKEETCGHCNGTGSADGKTTSCPHCNGTGMVSEVQQRGNMRMVSSHPCPHCGGTGKKITSPCPHCGGKGMKEKLIKERVVVPAGAQDGMFVTLSGKGCDLPKDLNGISGDLHVIFNVELSKDFAVMDTNLIHHLDVEFTDLLLGCEKDVKCIDGKTVSIKISELTKPTHVFTVRGKGMPNPHGGGYGNMMVKLNLIIPKTLSKKQKELLKEFKNS